MILRLHRGEGDGIVGATRIARHLWRMCLGLTLAAGSAFTMGARFVPGA